MNCDKKCGCGYNATRKVVWKDFPKISLNFCEFHAKGYVSHIDFKVTRLRK